MGGEGTLARIGWTILSIGLFASLWELCWLIGWADPKLLPPPHIFLGSIADQGKFFNTATRWQVGKSMTDGPSAFELVMITIGATTMRVFVGLLIATVLGIGIGVLVRYFKLFDRLVLPTVTLLSPVSPIAWFARGRTALGMTAAAAEGRFELQVCQRCAAVQYPPRDACHRCLSPQLRWTAQQGGGELISETVLASQQRSVLPRAAAVAARPGPSRRRADGDRSPARRRRVAPPSSPAPRRRLPCASTSARASTAPAPRC